MNSKSRVFEEDEMKKPKLDLKDKKLLFYLNQNCRIPNKKLARLLHLSPTSVRNRIRSLEERGIVISFLPILYGKLLQSNLYFISMQFQKAPDKKFFEYIRNHESVQAVFKVSGSWDLFMAFVARDSVEASNVVQEFRNKLGDKLGRFSLEEALYEYKYSHIASAFFQGLETELLKPKADSSFSKELQDTTLESEYPSPPANLDKTDLKILELLSQDARTRLTTIARKVGISDEGVRYRIRRLIKKGILLGFMPFLSFSKLGFHFYLVFIQVRNFAQKEEEFKKYVLSHPYIIETARLLGQHDIMIAINVRSPLQFAEILDEIKSRFADVITSVESMLVLEEQKYNHFLKVYYKYLRG